MPTADPHPIDITVYDTDNTTLKASAKVYVINASKGTKSSEETTDASGQAIIDLANLPIGSGKTLPYEVGDVILVVTYSGNNSDAKRYVVAGSENSETLYLNPVRHTPSVSGEATHIETITTLIVANTTATPYYAKVYNGIDARQILHIECPANDSKIVIGKIPCAGGIIIERENSGLIVSTIIY